LFSDSDYELRLLERKANAPRFQARAQKNRNLMRNSVRLRQVIERAAELDIYLPKVLVKMVSECLFGKIPSDWDQSPELGGAGAGGW